MVLQYKEANLLAACPIPPLPSSVIRIPMSFHAETSKWKLVAWSGAGTAAKTLSNYFSHLAIIKWKGDGMTTAWKRSCDISPPICRKKEQQLQPQPSTSMCCQVPPCAATHTHTTLPQCMYLRSPTKLELALPIWKDTKITAVPAYRNESAAYLLIYFSRCAIQVLAIHFSVFLSKRPLLIVEQVHF